MSNITERKAYPLPGTASDKPVGNPSIGTTGHDAVRQMKDRIGLVGRMMISGDERRVTREELKKVLRNELASQTEELLNRNRLQLSLTKERDYAAYLQLITEIEKFLLSQQAKTQHELNELIDRFEDAYTIQFMDNVTKLKSELDAGRITQPIYDNRMIRAQSRYDDAMDKCMAEMRMVIDKHKVNMENALRSAPDR